MKIYVESLLNGLMVYWDEVKEAARYYVHLLIGDKHLYKDGYNLKSTGETFQEIAVVEVNRDIKYYSFVNLAKIDEYHQNWSGTNEYSSGKNYYIYVEAEGKNGEIITKSERIKGIVYHMIAGYFSYHKK